MGVLFGPFAVIGAALGKPTPYTGKDTVLMSTNKDSFTNPDYLSCYSKKARGQNVTNALLGWAAWIIFIAVL